MNNTIAPTHQRHPKEHICNVMMMVHRRMRRSHSIFGQKSSDSCSNDNFIKMEIELMMDIERI